MADRRPPSRAHPPRPLVIPDATRPDIPQYGIPDDPAGLLDWAWVAERMASATLYWVSTVRPDGRPHSMPTWGAWVLDRLWLEGGLRTRRARNLAHRPDCTASTQRGEDVIIIEGRGERIADPSRDLVELLRAGFAKYQSTHGYVADPAHWREGGLWVIEPRVVFAWSAFPADCTRWVFGAAP